MNNGIILTDVSFSYSKGTQQLRNITTYIPKGSFVGITGVNGSGKTTISLLLNGLIPHEIEGNLSGSIIVDGIETKSKTVSFFAQKVGMLFQNPDFMLFNLTVAEEIGFGLKNFKLDNHDKRISNALEMVGLKGFENRDPQTLSLGEKQKVCLASILALDTEYIVLDEPVAMLDHKGALHLYQTLEELNKKHGKTIIVIEHDTDFINKCAKEIIVLDKGSIIFQGKTQEVFAHKEDLKKLGIKIPQPIM
jgi:energy-coupling factor transporter ATP-binding protein EcfA2